MAFASARKIRNATKLEREIVFWLLPPISQALPMDCCFTVWQIRSNLKLSPGNKQTSPDGGFQQNILIWPTVHMICGLKVVIYNTLARVRKKHDNLKELSWL